MENLLGLLGVMNRFRLDGNYGVTYLTSSLYSLGSMNVETQWKHHENPETTLEILIVLGWLVVCFKKVFFNVRLVEDPMKTAQGLRQVSSLYFAN